MFVGEGGGGGGNGVLVGGGGGTYMNVLVGVGWVVEVIVGMTVTVGGRVFVGRGVAGTLVSNDAPGVRKTLIQAGCVRMDGSRGSIKSSERLVR